MQKCVIAVIGLFGCCLAAMSPVIIVPGDGGSQLEARANKPSVPHFFCQKKVIFVRGGGCAIAEIADNFYLPLV
jgi:hypothetical protein